jgi:hypothetical protein
MKQLKDYIIEKLQINKDTKVKSIEEQKWDKLIQNWIQTLGGEDFEYLMELIDKFLTNNTFNNNEDYDELLKYENNEKFKEFLGKRFIQFKDDNEKQIQSLKNK